MNGEARYPFEVVGNLHVHSLHSDGAWTVPEITRAARGAGLDFFILNEHDFMVRSVPLEEEGYCHGVLVLAGLEIGGRDHHYLAYDLKRHFEASNLSPQEVIDRVSAQGAFGFLAHPFERGMPFMEHSVAYVWKDLSVRGYTGICIWNFMSRWKERIKSPFHGLLCVLLKSLTLKGPCDDTLAFWDRLCEERRVVAIGGSDAHGNVVKLSGVRFTPVSYEFLMRSINVHLFLDRPLSGDLPEARGQIYTAMKEGRLFIAHDALSPARGFHLGFLGGSGHTLGMGEEEAFAPGVIEVEAPAAAEFRLMKNGSCLRIQRGCRARFVVREKGVYRVAVYRRVPLFGWRPWIFSNPVYLR